MRSSRGAMQGTYLACNEVFAWKTHGPCEAEFFFFFISFREQTMRVRVFRMYAQNAGEAVILNCVHIMMSTLEHNYSFITIINSTFYFLNLFIV